MWDHANIMIWALFNSNLERRLPVHSAEITSGPLCASECVVVRVCVFVMVEVEGRGQP